VGRLRDGQRPCYGTDAVFLPLNPRP